MFYVILVTDPCVDKDGNPISSDPFEKPEDCDNFYQVGINITRVMYLM